MKRFFLAFFLFFGLFTTIQAQTYQDTTFTDPVLILYPDDFVSFTNCRFIGIDGDAIYAEGAGMLITNCTFESISGSAVVAFVSEVYIVEDTIREIGSAAIRGDFSAVVVLGSIIENVLGSAVFLNECEVGEVRDCHISDVLGGVFILGGDGYEECYIVNNQIRQVEGGGISINSVDLLSIEECVLDSCYGHGIFLGEVGDSVPSSTVSIQKNKISHTSGWGIYTNQVQNAIFRENEIQFPGMEGGIPDMGEGCFLWNGSNSRIEKNHFHHATDPGCGVGNCRSVGLWLSTPAIVVKNEIHDCTGFGIVYVAEQDVAAEELRIFNNIIYDNHGSSIAYELNPNATNPGEPSATLIRNNTLHSQQEAPLAVCCNQSLIRIDGNILIYEGVADTNQYILSNNAQFQETLNLKAPGDLNFVDFAGRDFHLATEISPAHHFLPLHFGLPNDDFDGDLRLGLRDAGADELSLEEIICGCNNCPNEIPDLFYGDFTFSVVAANNNDLADFAQGVCGVRVEFEHGYIGDVRMELRSPAGQVVQLIGPNGFWGATTNTTWNVGFVPCTSQASPDPGFMDKWNSDQAWGQTGSYTGLYYPSLGCLEDFNLGTVTGNWTLRAYDNQANDIGQVKGFEMMFCDMEGVTCFVCNAPPMAAFTPVNVGAWSAVLNNQTTGAASFFEVDYGDGQTESGNFFSFFHEYEQPGTYQLTLIATNDCGFDTTTQSVVIAGALPSAFVFAENTEGCVPLNAQTVVISEDHVDTWHWLFPGGTPAESVDPSPSVVYANAGTYNITLILENAVGETTYPDIITVNAAGLANPGFDLEVVGGIITCTQTTTSFESFYWTLDMGDPVGVNESPYIFDIGINGTYTITLTLIDSCGVLELSEEATVMIIGTQTLMDAGWQIGLSPNPNAGQFQLAIEAPQATPAVISVLDALGREIYQQSVDMRLGSQLFDLNLGALPAGVYVAQVQTGAGRGSVRFLVR